MWLYRTGGDDKSPIVLYEYQPDRRAVHPAKFLKDFEGYLHADGYDGYHSLPDVIIVIGCWSHARRRFDELLKMLLPEDRDGSSALIGKRYCDKLFKLDDTFADLTPKERLSHRMKYSKPVMDELFAWAEALNPTPKTGIGRAIHYLLSQKKYLERYLLDGRLEMSNNRAERSIKPFVIGRKNFLFANTPRGAKASAIMFSLIETAKENGLNPYKYLTYIFTHAPNMDIRNDIDALQLLMPDSVPKSIKTQNT
jgi:hypothetical protein